MKLATTIAGLTLAIGAVYSTPTTAQEVMHVNASQAVARCQGALPAFETAIRKRPLAIQNEGASSSFVTCGFELDVGESITGGPLAVDVYFINNNAAEVTVNCTAVTGFAGGDNEYVAFAADLVPGTSEEINNIFVLDEDFVGGGMETGLVALSCNLPSGVGITDSYVYWLSDDTPV